MIFTWLLNILYSALAWLHDALPVYSGLPSGISTAYYTFSGYTARACSLMPSGCTAIHYCVYASLAIAFFIIVFYGLAWIFHWRQK